VKDVYASVKAGGMDVHYKFGCQEALKVGHLEAIQIRPL